MALPEQYLITTKNVEAFFNSLLSAQAPTRFTTRFLEQLDFKSTNDRLYLGVLKLLKFIDQGGTPQDIYFRFLDRSQSKTVLAEAIKDSYSDLFAVNTKAYDLSATDIKNKLKTLTQGTKSDKVLTLMANTFIGLCKYADFSKGSNTEVSIINRDEDPADYNGYPKESQKLVSEVVNKNITTEMHYNIQIHLPETRDATVYDAIFKSLKEHLL